MDRAAARGADTAAAVRAWRPDGLPRVIAMDGVVSSHSAEPRGEYMIGVIERRPMSIVRGERRHVVGPGSLAVLDPSISHRGVPAADGPWRCRLLIMELPDVVALASDPGLGREVVPLFPDPVPPDRSTCGTCRTTRWPGPWCRCSSDIRPIAARTEHGLAARGR